MKKVTHITDEMVAAAEEAYMQMGDMHAALSMAFEAFPEQDEKLHQLSNKYIANRLELTQVLCDHYYSRIKELEQNQCTCKTKRISHKGKVK